MTDSSLEAVRETFADLTGLLEDAALIASVGQGVKSFKEGRRQLTLISTALNRIRRRLNRLERRLG